ncbi:hypothetical protein BL470_005232 [Escherichia coli]|nr:hypothetical protein [Salmonella enterica subsp. enterica serovar Newport]EFG9941143.1 hypothetical protein [Escherichia coli]MIL10218.1 hypothetical protein [Salmonella enterica subsp. enterica serovar Enteritidis]
MWPTRIHNPVFLRNLYGDPPDLGAVELNHVDLSREGPELRLSIISRVLPANPPAKWGAFNRVLFSLRCFDLQSVEITSFGRAGLSFIRMWDDGPGIRLSVEGVCRIEAEFRWLYVDSIDGGLLEERSDIRLVRQTPSGS